MSSMLTSDSPAFWKGKASTSTTVGSCWVAQFAPQYPKLSASLSTWWVVAPWLKGFEQRALGRKHRSFPWTNWGFFPNPWRTWKWVSFVRRRAPLVFQKFRETENGNSLVGGLEHVWYFPYIGNSNHNWLICFRGVQTTNHQPVVEFLFSEMLLAHADHESQQEGVSWCKLNWSNRSILMKDCQCRQACSEQMIRYKFPIFQFQPHFVYSSIMLHHVTSQYISSSIDFQISTRGLWFLILNSLDIPKTWYSSAGIFHQGDHRRKGRAQGPRFRHPLRYFQLDMSWITPTWGY